MKQLNLIPEIYASDFPGEVTDELVACDVSTHYQNDVISLNWEPEDPDDVSYPKLQAWLLETYGDEIKRYTSIAIWAT